MKERERGIGIDVVAVDRVRRLIDHQPELALARIYCAADLIGIPALPVTDTRESSRIRQRYYQTLALKFAAKEATIKALSFPIQTACELHEIAVRGLHQFSIHLSPRLEEIAGQKRISRLHGSGSFCGDCAIAVVFAE